MGHPQRRLGAAAEASVAEQRPRTQQGHIRAAARLEADSWLTKSGSLASGLRQPLGRRVGGRAPRVYTCIALSAICVGVSTAF